MRNSLSKKPELEEGQQTIFFQIANGNARQSMQPEDQISNPAPGFSLSTGTGSSKWRGIVWQGNVLKTAGSIW
jgi:hypothetical protein